jgi:cysteine synthase
MFEFGIGNTPLFELPSSNDNRIFVKLEGQNFLGSIKARTGYAIIKGILDDLPKDTVIVESTSGNLGIALDYFCKEVGRSFLCLLDKTVPSKKLEYLQDKGINCELVETEPGADGRTSRMKRAAELSAAGQHWWSNQYDNENGVHVHKTSTAPEIYDQTHGSVTSVFCAVGSGGTICGLGEYFHEKNPEINIFGVEPFGSTIYHYNEANYITAGAGLRG